MFFKKVFLGERKRLESRRCGCVVASLAFSLFSTRVAKTRVSKPEKTPFFGLKIVVFLYRFAKMHKKHTVLRRNLQADEKMQKSICLFADFGTKKQGRAILKGVFGWSVRKKTPKMLQKCFKTLYKLLTVEEKYV